VASDDDYARDAIIQLVDVVRDMMTGSPNITDLLGRLDECKEIAQRIDRPRGQAVESDDVE
jgi:hypothetical protein